MWVWDLLVCLGLVNVFVAVESRHGDKCLKRARVYNYLPLFCGSLVGVENDVEASKKLGQCGWVAMETPAAPSQGCRVPLLSHRPLNSACFKNVSGNQCLVEKSGMGLYHLYQE